MLTKHLFKGVFSLAVAMGNGLRLFTNARQRVSLSTTKEIVINRSDRIGDAVITKPLLILFHQYALERNSSLHMHILASSLNYEVLKDIPGYSVEVKKTELHENPSMIWMIRKQFSNLFHVRRPQKKKTSWKIFLDLIGDVDMINEYYTKGYACMWPNLFLSNVFLSYALPYTYRGPKIANLIEYYIDLIEGGFGLHGTFREYVYTHIDAFYDIQHSHATNDMLIFIGNKKEKNLSVSAWKEVIKLLSTRFPDRTLSVIDDHTNVLYHEMAKDTFASNVQLVKNEFSHLMDFKKYGSQFAYIVGTDGGGINLIRNLTHTLILYPTGPENYKVRSRFFGRKEDSEHRQYDATSPHLGVSINSIQGKYFGYIYKKDRHDSYENRREELLHLINIFFTTIDEQPTL